MSVNKIEISWSSLWKVFAMVLFVVALYYIRETLAVVFAAVILSSSIYSPVKYLEKKGIPKFISVFVLFLLIGAILVLVLYTLLPIALIQLQYLLNNLASIESPIFEAFGFSDIIGQLRTEAYDLFKNVLSGGASIVNIFSGIVSNIFFIVSTIVLSFYLSISKDGVERFIKAITPTTSEKRVINLYLRTRRKLERWLAGQLTLSVIIGLLTFVGLTIVGNEYSILLSVLAAVLELIPYIGPIIVGVIAFLLTLQESLAAALVVVLIFFIIQELENNLFVPLVMSKAVDTDPVTVVIALLAGSQLAGMLGLLLAVPSVIVIEEVMDDLSKKIHKEEVKEVA